MNARRTLVCVLFAAALALSWLLPRIDRPPSERDIAHELLASGRPEDALLLLSDPVWRGVAQYRAGRYTRAIGEFYPAETTLALYNIGTAYAQLEEWSGAIAALEKVLRLEPEHADARHNLEIAMKAAQLEADLALQSNKGPLLEGTEGEQRRRPTAKEGEPKQTRSSGADETDATTVPSDADEEGNSAQPGELGDGEQTDKHATAVAVGNADTDGAPREHRPGASSKLKIRESKQAAEILLRQIEDDPESVLRVRLYTVHQNRQGGEATTQ